MNKDIGSTKVQQFFSNIRVQDVYHVLNNISFLEMNNIHITGFKPIYTIIVILNIIECIEGCKLYNTNEIIINNYQSYMVDINFERYFQAQLSHWDKIN